MTGRIRRCAKCGKEKPIEEFPRKMSNQSGYSGVCTACTPPPPKTYPPGAVQSMCGRKRRYPSKAAATGAALRSARRTSLIRIYPCPVCQGYHLTHKPKREPR